jgi:hypothetical protein
VRSAWLEGFLTSLSKASEELNVTTSGDKEEKSANLAHETWIALDQQVLGFLLSSLSGGSAAGYKLQKRDCGMEDNREPIWLLDSGVSCQCSLGPSYYPKG